MGGFIIKKLAFLLVICLAFCSVGCQKNEFKQSENNYEQSEDKSEFGSIKNKNNSNQNGGILCLVRLVINHMTLIHFLLQKFNHKVELNLMKNL